MARQKSGPHILKAKYFNFRKAEKFFCDFNLAFRNIFKQVEELYKNLLYQPETQETNISLMLQRK